MDIFSWAGGMGGGEMGDSSVAVVVVAAAVAVAAAPSNLGEYNNFREKVYILKM